MLWGAWIADFEMVWFLSTIVLKIVSKYKVTLVLQSI